MDIQAVITIILAIITCFYGYKLNKVLIAILGLFIGFKLGVTVLPNIIADQTIIYILSAIIAIIIGIASYNLYLIGIFLLCALAVYILCGNLGLTGTTQTIVGVIAGIFAGILGVKFTRPLIIITTSFAASSLISETLLPILNIQNDIVSLIVIIIFAILGMTYQFNQKEVN